MILMFFRVESSDVSSNKHQLLINETMMIEQWRNSYAYVFYCWIQRHKTTKSSNFIISNQIE